MSIEKDKKGRSGISMGALCLGVSLVLLAVVATWYVTARHYLDRLGASRDRSAAEAGAGWQTRSEVKKLRRKLADLRYELDDLKKESETQKARSAVLARWVKDVYEQAGRHYRHGRPRSHGAGEWQRELSSRRMQVLRELGP